MSRGFALIQNLIPYSTAWRTEDNGDFLIVSNEKHEIFYLNETSALFYTLCNGCRSIDEVKMYMLDEYDVPVAQLEQDIVSLVRDFQWQGIIHLKERRIRSEEKI